jgi:hypothetical protein
MKRETEDFRASKKKAKKIAGLSRRTNRAGNSNGQKKVIAKNIAKLTK